MNLPSDSEFAVWVLVVLASLVAAGLCIRAEGRWFAQHGKRRSWLTLRICSIPIAISSIGLVFIVARSIRGPEALAMTYTLFLTAAPAVYFAQHLIAGRWTTPRLTGGESAWIGFSGLVFVLAPPALVSAVRPWIQDAGRLIDFLF